MTDLELTAPADLRDWRVFTQRAQRLDPDGAMRLAVHGPALVLTVSPLHPHGLGDPTPLALGMRIVRLTGPELDGTDVIVPLAALGDRFARAESQGHLRVPVPPQEVRVPWAGITPPRGPWEESGEIAAAEVRAAAAEGIAEVAAGVPGAAGGPAVSALRRRIWSRPLAGVAGVGSGVALALDGLGFLAGAHRVAVRRAGTWARLSTDTGHVLTRTVG